MAARKVTDADLAKAVGRVLARSSAPPRIIESQRAAILKKTASKSNGLTEG